MLMLVGIGVFIVQLKRSKTREEFITYIRNFKKGKGVLIYILAIPLYMIGLIYAGEGAFSAIFSSIRRVVDLIVLKYEIVHVQALVSACPIYGVVMYLMFVFVGLNAALFAMSLFSHQLWRKYTNYKFNHSTLPRLFIFGNNEASRAIYNSESTRSKILIDKYTDKQACFELYLKDIVYRSVEDNVTYVKEVIADAVTRKNETIVVINTGSDTDNLTLSRTFADRIASYTEKLESGQEKNPCFGMLRVFVIGDAKYEAIYLDVVKDSFGCLTYINKYQKMAIDFIDRYPFASFLTSEHVDYDTSLIKDGVELNAFFIGFGRTNQQMFLTSVANNQFIHKVDGKVCIQQVKYHIFDKYPSENNKNLNHNYNRYKKEVLNDQKELPKERDGIYLDLPDYPAVEEFYHFGVNDMNFYQTIHDTVLNSAVNANFIVIAFGSDLENVDMAQKLSRKCSEWGFSNMHIFVKVRDADPAKLLKGIPNCYVIGNENDSLYNIDKIVADEFFVMARMRDEIYGIENDLKNEAEKKVLGSYTDEYAVKVDNPDYLAAQAEKNGIKWYLKKCQIERDSSIYASLSLRSKLNLMGLDYMDDVPELQGVPTPTGLTAAEYIDIYAGSDLPDYEYYNVSYKGKPIIYYTIDFADSRRRNMAIHEHLRWNSYMISQGVIPATIDQILHEKDPKGNHTNGKNYNLRHHGNITTFDGLVAFRQLIANRDGKTAEERAQLEVQKDVIMYDYQLLDDAYYILARKNYKIVKLEAKRAFDQQLQEKKRQKDN